MLPIEKMNFEQERLSHERAQLIKEKIQHKFEGLGRKATPDEIIDIVNGTLREANPESGELIYEMDENE